MTTVGEKQYQFDNFKVEGGALQFPALATKSSIRIADGNFAAASRAALDSITGGTLSDKTALSLNGKKVVVYTNSLLSFAEAVASGSKTAEDLTQMVKELSSDPELLGSFVLSLVANSKLTGELEKLSALPEKTEAEKSAAEAATVLEADNRLKARENASLVLLKKPELSAEASAAINSALSKKLEKVAVVKESGTLVSNASLKTKLAIENTLFSKLQARELLSNPKAVDRFQQAQMIAKIKEKAAEKAYADARQIVLYEAPKAGLSTAKKVALASAAALAAITAGVLYADPMGFFAPEPVVVEEAVEETSNAIYAVGAVALGLGAVAARLAYVKASNALATVVTVSL